MSEQINQTALAKIENTAIVQQLNLPETVKQFDVMLGSGRALHFITSLKVVFAGNKDLLECTPESIINGAMQGASLDLSFDPSLGEAYLVPFNKKIKEKGQPDRWVKEATFIPGYKGLIQLGIRTGQYRTISGMPVTDRMLQKLQDILQTSDEPRKTTIRFFESIEFFPDLLIGKVVGYVAYFVLHDGFAQSVFWTKERCLEHGQKYSKTFKFGPWQSSEDAMCLKTVFRQLFGKYAPKSKEMRTAFEKETESLAMFEEPRGYYGALGTGDEDEELFGAEPAPLPAEEPTQAAYSEKAFSAAYEKIETLQQELGYNTFAVTASCKKHLGKVITRLAQCKDMARLTDYYKYLQGKQLDAWLDVVGAVTPEKCDEFIVKAEAEDIDACRELWIAAENAKNADAQ